jgi:hypothetical protein
MTAREKSRHRTARYSTQIVEEESISEYFTFASRYFVHTVMPEKIHGKIKGKRKQGSEKYVNYG